MAEADPAAAELVKLRYFAGLSIPQAAEALGIGARSADRTTGRRTVEAKDAVRTETWAVSCCGPRENEKATARGAQTSRPGGAAPVSADLQARLTGRFVSSVGGSKQRFSSS